jgi:hypothetical protein
VPPMPLQEAEKMFPLLLLLLLLLLPLLLLALLILALRPLLLAEVRTLSSNNNSNNSSSNRCNCRAISLPHSIHHLWPRQQQRRRRHPLHILRPSSPTTAFFPFHLRPWPLSFAAVSASCSGFSPRRFL